MSGNATTAEHLNRQPGESAEDYVQRMIVQTIFMGATDVELADWCDVSPTFVRQVRRDLERTETMRQMLSHARHVASETGFEGRASTMVHEALAAYSEAYKRRNGQTDHGSPAGPEIGRRGSRGGTRDAGRSQDGRALTRQGDGQTGEAGTLQPSSRCAASGGVT